MISKKFDGKFKCDKDLKEVLAKPTFTKKWITKSAKKLRFNSFYSQSTSFDSFDGSLSDDDYLVQKIKEEVDSDYQTKSSKSFELQDDEEAQEPVSKCDNFFGNFYFNLLTQEMKSKW